MCVADPTPGDIQHFGSGIWGAELVRLESNNPITVISGDIDGSNFGAYLPFVTTSPFLPPTAVVDPSQMTICPGETVDFDGSGSFDQDTFGSAPDIVQFDWDFDDGSPVVIDGGPVQSHEFVSSGTFFVTLRVTDNEVPPDQQTDDDVSTVTVLPATDPTCNEPPEVSCLNPTVGTDAGQCSAAVACSAIGSCSDPDGDATSLSCDPTGPFGEGTTSVSVTCNDGLLSTSDSCPVTVVDDEAPSASCPAGTTISADANCEASIPDVTGGVSASDNCSAAANLTITQSPVAGTVVSLGTHPITLTVRVTLPPKTGPS